MPSYFNPSDSYLYNRRVIRLDDDSPCPKVGRVLGWADEETCVILWDGADAPTEEFADEITPRR